MIKIYRKTSAIKAEQFDSTQEMFDRYKMIDSGQVVDGLHVSNTCLIKTLEGYLHIHHHDWIATGVDGEHWPIADAVFKRTYAELPVIPKAVADWMELGKSKNISLDTIFLIVIITHGDPQDFEATKWIRSGHMDDFVRAWLDGYQVEADE